MQKKFKKIKDAAVNNRIIWGKHSYIRINERFTTKDEIISAISVGEIIEDYSDDKPFPSCLIFGMVNNRPIHVVVAYDEKNETIFIITLYEPNVQVFESDLKTRRKK